MRQAARFLGLLGLLTFLGLCVPAVRAADADESVGQPYVVLVGISHYADKHILPRPTAEADVKSLYDVFVSKDHLGVDARHIKLLLGKADPKRDSEPATRANVLKALAWAAKSARKNDLVIIGLFVQGAPLGERGCYFASDSTFKNRAKDAIATGDVEQALKKLKSQRFVALLDVNFKGWNSGKEKAPDVILSNFYREFLGNPDDEKAPTVSRAIFLANSGLKPSLTVDGHGAFAKVLVDGLKGKADTAGYEPDGLITVEELAKYVRKEVPDLAHAQGKTEDERGMVPLILEGQTTNFVLAHNPAVTAKTQARVESFEKIATKNEFPKSWIEEGDHLLHRMPKLEAKQQLRKAYQKLADHTIKVAEFRKERESLLAKMQLSDRDAAYYARTVMKAADMVKAGFFKEVNEGQLVDSAIRGLYKHLGENLPSALKDRLAKAKMMTKADLLHVLADARKHLGKREDLDNGNDITYSLHPMLEKLDRHTDYIDPETLRRMEVDIRGHFSGIGVQIRRNNSKDALQVVTPIRGSPAYKAGIYAGDLITRIIRETDDKGRPLSTPEEISTKGMSTEDAVKKILGREGTKIKLVVDREGSKKPLEFELIRGRVEVETVLGTKRNSDDSWNYVIDPENKICYIRLTQFSSNTYRDLNRVMSKLSKAGIKGFILDLRFNPGGLLDSAVKIADLFIDDGVIVTIRPRNGAETSYIGKSDGSYLEFPMVCLVNGYSASASEIVSACLQDHGRAIIMGSRSYGKGSVQTIQPFDTASGPGKLKLTTATFWRPSKKNLNKASTPGREEDEWGVTPNKGYVLKLPTKELNDLQDHLRDAEIIRRPDKRNVEPPMKTTPFHDRQLDMALEYLRGQIRLAAQGSSKREGS
jgi:carboxyl-terminal processing protease